MYVTSWLEGYWEKILQWGSEERLLLLYADCRSSKHPITLFRLLVNSRDGQAVRAEHELTPQTSPVQVFTEHPNFRCARRDFCTQSAQSIGCYGQLYLKHVAYLWHHFRDAVYMYDTAGNRLIVYKYINTQTHDWGWYSLSLTSS